MARTQTDRKNPDGNGLDKNAIVSSASLEALTDTISEYSDKAVASSKKAVDRTVETVKEYPIHSALIAATFGFFAGIVGSKLLKK